MYGDNGAILGVYLLQEEMLNLERHFIKYHISYFSVWFDAICYDNGCWCNGSARRQVIKTSVAYFTNTV